ncbi:MAG TPA: energy-coupling factor transporter transmembrane component T, partial [Armatimonadota bacterium]|nr:energy-coupling factor transporter transmembrane component T [Armatimonadota bacterium]
MSPCEPPPAQCESPLRRLDARVKVVCAGVLVAAMLALPVRANAWLWAYAALILALAALGRLRAGWLGGRVVILLPFLIIGAALVPLARPVSPQDLLGLPTAWGELTLSRLALTAYLSVAGKCLLCLLAASVVVGTTMPADLLRAAQGLGAPRTVTALLGFAVTYLSVLADEVRRMTVARDSRGGRPGLLRGIAVAAAMLRTLMIRTFERAERIALAMVARGYDGRMPDLHRGPVPAAHVAAGALFIAIAIIPHLTGIWS